MKLATSFLFVSFVALFFLGQVEIACAAVSWTGNIEPADPTTWTTDDEDTGYIGKLTDGSLTINTVGGASNVEGYHGYLGYGSNATGTLTVDGAGATWNTRFYLYVGHFGTGSVSVTNGGLLSGSSGILGYLSGATGIVTVDGSGSKWNDRGFLYPGYKGNGTLNVTHGGEVVSGHAYFAYNSGATGAINVDGAGSIWTNRWNLNVGHHGSATLNITNGGEVNGGSLCDIGSWEDSTGTVNVDGIGSAWNDSGDLFVGRNGTGTLNITNGGLVNVIESLTIDDDGDGDSFINMTSGGMLALPGDVHNSLSSFLGLIGGTSGAIRYWDDSFIDWAPITSATPGDDYTLAYINDTSSDLYGYTVLTVGAVPEPSTIAMLCIGAVGFLFCRREH